MEGLRAGAGTAVTPEKNRRRFKCCTSDQWQNRISHLKERCFKEIVRNCKTQVKLNTSNSSKYGFVGDLEDGTGPKLEPNTEGIVGTILSLCVIHRRTQAQRCQELEVLWPWAKNLPDRVGMTTVQAHSNSLLKILYLSLTRVLFSVSRMCKTTNK